MKLLFILLVGTTLSGFGFNHDYPVWDGLLKKHVKQEGPVSTFDYRALRRDRTAFDAFIKEIESVSLDSYKGMVEGHQLAFLINSYNALTVKLILDNYPTPSIKKLGSLFKSAWKQKFFTMLGEEHHLDWIEHEMIRPVFNEPKIHFAVVCASVGCPQLRNEVYHLTKLPDQLENGAKNFLSDTSRNRFDEKENKLYLSSIFKWYGDDFVKKYGSVQSFVLPYFGKKEVRDVAQAKKVEMEFLDYDWNLNEPK